MRNVSGAVRNGALLWIVGLALGALGQHELAAVESAPPRSGGKGVVPDEQFDLPQHAVARLGGSRFSSPHVVNAVAISPDGRWLAAGGIGSDICLWDMATGKQQWKVRADVVQVGALAFLPDSELLATGGADGVICLFEVATGKAAGQMVVDVPIDALASSSTGRLLLAGGADGSVTLWDARSQERLAKWGTQATGAVADVAFGTDDKMAYCVPNKGSVVCQDIQSKRKVYQVATKYPIGIALRISADRELLAVVSGQAEPPRGAIQIFDAKTGAERKLIDLPGGQFKTAAFTPDGKRLAVTITRMRNGTPNCTVEMIDWANVRRLWQSEPDSFPPKTAAMSADGKLLAVGGQDELVKLFDLENGKELFARPRLIRNVMGIEYSPSGRWLAVSSGSMSFDKLGRISLWELTRSGYEPRSHYDCVFPMGLAFSDDNRSVLASHFDASISRREVETGKLEWANEARKNLGLTEVASTVLCDGRAGEVFVPQMNGEIRVLDAASGADVRSGYLQIGVMSAGFCRDRNLLTLAGTQGDVALWDTQKHSQVGTFAAHDAKVSSIAIAPRGNLLVTGSMDCTVRLWDPANTTAPRILKGHRESVLAVAVSPDGRLVASGDSSGEIVLWETTRGQLVRRHEQSGQITCLRFSPDSAHLASAGLNGKVLIWNVGQVSPGGASDLEREAQRGGPGRTK